jgi:hypothetical protein
MLFEITTSGQSTLPVSRQINSTLWLHTIDHKLDYGYRLGAHGGNFLNFKLGDHKLEIDFSFFKDYVLSQDIKSGVLLSSANLHANKIKSNAIKAIMQSDNSIKFVYYDLKDLILQRTEPVSLVDAINRIEKILVENLFELQQQTTNQLLKISYSAGLDSGTLAWLCHKHKIDFVALVDHKLWPKLNNLPFKTVVAEISSPVDLNTIDHTSWTSFVPGNTYFCNPQHNNYVSGFYGDLTMLHIRHMYIQSKHLVTDKLDNIEEYDHGQYDNNRYENLKFRNRQDLVNSIIKIHLEPHAREWFLNFETTDPYRDPRFLKIFLSLSTNDLVKQFKTAIVQKTIIKNIEPNCYMFMCKNKNDFSTIGQPWNLT